MKKTLAAIAAFFVALSLFTVPSDAMDRTQHLTGLNPPSTWMNQEQRDVRIGFGTAIWNMLGASGGSWTGAYSDLSVVPVTGLFVAVGPTTANTVGAVYQLLAEETTGYGGFPSGVGVFLPADTTKVALQGLAASNTANIGPLNPPGTGGQSINYLLECQVQITDTTSQSVNIVSSGGSVTATAANRDRKDIVACQSKAGTAATTGSQTTPAVDAGWVAIGFAAVANGTVTITSGMITALTAQQFFGFVQASSLGSNAVLLSPSSQQSGNVNVSGTGTFGGALSAVGLTSSAGVAAGGALTGVTNGTLTGFLNVGNGVAASSGVLGVGQSATAGEIFIGGAINNALLDYGNTVSQALTLKTVANSGTLFLGVGGTLGAGQLVLPTNIAGNVSVFTTGNSAGMTLATVAGTALALNNSSSNSYFTVDSSGNMGIAGVYHNVSSIKYKQRIRYMPREWALKLAHETPLITYCYKTEAPQQCGSEAGRGVRFHIGYPAEYTPKELSGNHQNQVEPGSVAMTALAAAAAVDDRLSVIKKDYDAQIAALQREINILSALVGLILLYLAGQQLARMRTSPRS